MASKTDLKILLHKSGYKATPTRLAVLALLQKSRNPVSAQDILEALHGADQATIYRTVKSLKQSSRTWRSTIISCAPNAVRLKMCGTARWRIGRERF